MTRDIQGQNFFQYCLPVLGKGMGEWEVTNEQNAFTNMYNKLLLQDKAWFIEKIKANNILSANIVNNNQDNAVDSK